MIKFYIFYILSVVFLSAQEIETDMWQPFKYFIGSWNGHETGKGASEKENGIIRLS
jgi:hypothetical protein